MAAATTAAIAAAGAAATAAATATTARIEDTRSIKMEIKRKHDGLADTHKPTVVHVAESSPGLYGEN